MTARRFLLQIQYKQLSDGLLISLNDKRPYIGIVMQSLRSKGINLP